MTEQVNERKKPTKKDFLIQDLKIVLWAIPSLLLIVLMLLEMLPQRGTGLEMKKQVTVSSALVSVSSKDYVSAVNGTLYNPTDDTIVVDSLSVTVGDGRTDRKITFQGFTMPPRTEKELSQGWVGMVEYDRVLNVKVTIDGDETQLFNNSVKTGIGGAVIFFLVLLIPVALMLIRACKIRYYLYQESKMG